MRGHLTTMQHDHDDEGSGKWESLSPACPSMCKDDDLAGDACQQWQQKRPARGHVARGKC